MTRTGKPLDRSNIWREMKKISLDKSLIVAEESEILEDLIIAAYNDAKAKADANMAKGVNDVTGGLNLGGLKLPF